MVEQKEEEEEEEGLSGTQTVERFPLLRIKTVWRDSMKRRRQNKKKMGMDLTDLRGWQLDILLKYLRHYQMISNQHISPWIYLAHATPKCLYFFRRTTTIGTNFQIWLTISSLCGFAAGKNTLHLTARCPTVAALLRQFTNSGKKALTPELGPERARGGLSLGFTAAAAAEYARTMTVPPDRNQRTFGDCDVD